MSDENRAGPFGYEQKESREYEERLRRELETLVLDSPDQATAITKIADFFVRELVALREHILWRLELEDED